MKAKEIRTLVISRDNVETAVSMKEVIDVVEEANKIWGLGEAVGDYHHTLFENVDPASLPKPCANFQSFSAYLKDGFDVHGIASCASCPHNPKQFALPYLTGVLVLNDRSSGAPLAIIEMSRLVELVTTATSAVGAKYLANKEADTIGIIGCGNQGRTHLQALNELFNIKKVLAFDISEKVSEKFAKEMSKKIGVAIERPEGAEQVVRASDILPILISSPRPSVKYEWIKPGALIIAASGFGQELYKEDVYRNVDKIVMDEWASYANDCLDDIGATDDDRRVDRVLIDNWKKWQDGCKPSDFSDPLIKAEYGLELPKIILGRQKGRQSCEEKIVFLHAGMGANMVAAGHLIYTRAKEKGIGTEIRLL